ncbi:MAG: hypothetical protein U9R51_01875 [Actinomycetota bacterium]|nr:hypothetical protein [Actinomycetota bacterium]
MSILFALLLSVTLAAPFGDAEARALEIDSGMTVEISVAVVGGRSAVLVRAVALAGELPPVAMVDQGNGTWVGILRLAGREDVQVAFEAIDGGGGSVISDLRSLTDLGVDPAVISSTRPVHLPPEDTGPNWWLVGGVITGLAALILLVVWAAGYRTDNRSKNPDRSEDVDQTANQPAPESDG